MCQCLSFLQVRAQNLIVLDQMMMEKAKDLAVLFEIEAFKASNGWLQNFKKRYFLQRRNAHGESNSADLSGVELARRAVPKIIDDGNYKPEDVFNFDETGLFTKSRPSASLSTGEYICVSEIHPHEVNHSWCGNDPMQDVSKATRSAKIESRWVCA